MDETTKMHIAVGKDVPDMLTELAGGTRKKGAYLTKLVRAAHAGKNVGKNEFAVFKMQIAGLSVELENLQARVQTLESK